VNTFRRLVVLFAVRSPWELIPDERSRNKGRSDDDLVDHHAMARQFAFANDKQVRVGLSCKAGYASLWQSMVD
jgi:hypothetical protein